VRRIFLIVKSWWLLCRLSWLNFRLSERHVRIHGTDLFTAHQRAEAAAQRAYDRGLLSDPTDIEGAERTGKQAFYNALNGSTQDGG